MRSRFRIPRRLFLAGAAGMASALALDGAARARGRSAVGGRLTLRVPWPIAAIDPHRLDDVAAGIFGDALFDTLYARDDAGALVPSLAEAEPQAEGNVLRVVLRTGLRTAAGRPLEARDVVTSLHRARTLGARAWLVDIPQPRVDADARQALLFAMRDPQRLVRALASPLTAIVPSTFAAERPDGTGPFHASRRGDALVLSRNASAARGPAILDEVIVRFAPGLDASLREFEKGADDLGWLGSGYFETRPGSRPFDAGAIGWALLRTGRDVGAEWDLPGVAQSLADSIPHAQLAPLVVGPAWPSTGPRRWGGAPCELLVRSDSPWLIELAKNVAAALSAPSHEVTPRAIAPSELASRRASRQFALAIDVTRPMLHGAFGARVALASADEPASAVDAVRHPPLGGDMSPRALTRMMRVGIVGELRVQGGRMPDVQLPVSSAAFGIDFGAATRRHGGP